MKAVIAVALLVLAGLVQAGETIRYQARAEGRLVIGPEGNVVDVQLEDVDWMDAAVRRGYEEKIRAWRFQPVIENGKAINAAANMSLLLAAVRNDETKTAHFAVERVTFTERENAAWPEGTKITRYPSFPALAARNGIGAVVMLVARLDAEGRPEAMAVEQMLLIGRHPGAQDKRLAGQFERATFAAAKHWRLAGVAPGELVRIPVKYSPPGHVPRIGWEQVFPVASELPGWLTEARNSASRVVDLADNGSVGPEKFKLLTPLESAGKG